MAENRKPESVDNEQQNIEYRMLNVEGEKTSSFEIPCSVFKIGEFDVSWLVSGLWLLVSGN